MAIKPKFKCCLVLINNFIAYSLGILSHFILIYQYPETDNPYLKDSIDPDAIDVVIFLATSGLFFAVVAFLLSWLGMRRKHLLREIVLIVISIGALLICGSRLAEVIPVYPDEWWLRP